MADTPLVEFDDLHVTFPTSGKPVEAVRGVSYTIMPGETVGVVGESGSGKSVTAMSLLRLNEMIGAYVPKGRIHFNSRDHGRIDLAQAADDVVRGIRGKEISMIFQEPMTCLNPVLSLRTQLTEPLFQHQGLDPAEAEEKIVRLLSRVRIPDPLGKLAQYPHHLSGGQRQRVMIAMALACEPALLIADEPTTALDVTIQAQILDLIKDIQEEFGMSVMFITHDMAVIAEMADRVVVMYQGQVVEQGPVDQIFHAPQHPYTRKLINAVPRIGSMTGKPAPEKFPAIAG
ncbi:MAG: ABC transporter ATP-binding protein [Alphaproteobacteria bacterium]